MLAERILPGPRWTFVGGKGGVGKTTVAAALAVSLADAGERTTVLSVDPAHSLGDALGVPLGGAPRDVPGVDGLEALEVDAEAERARFLAEHREMLLRVVERGTYMEAEDVEGFLRLAWTGVDELAALLRLRELAAEPSARVVVDTAPTGHTLRLLDLPRLAGGWIGALEAMEARHRQVATALAGSWREDDAARALSSLRADVERLAALLRDPAHTRFLLVTNPGPVVEEETRRYLRALGEREVPLGGVVVNRASPADAEAFADAGTPVVTIPLLPEEPRGPEALRRFAEHAGSPAAPPPAAALSPAVRVGAPYHPPADRTLYVVGGKGGVGKSTAASALAVRLADEGRRVLLLSSDPAGSLGGLFRVEVGDAPVPAPGAEGLRLRQVDAAGEWEAFRARYREEVERLFAEVLGEGLSADADREVVSRLVELAPPGVDEAVALAEVIDLLEGTEYNALVLDTAPTGHLLRLLEMPGVALGWAHALLRLFLKYREVVGLGETAERVLAFARLVRGLRARLRDRAHTFFLAVALPEALGVPEAERLVPRLAALGLPPEALLLNRLLGPEGVLPGRRAEALRLLAVPGAGVAVGAPECGEGPRGAEALRRFAGSWRHVHPG